MALAAEIVAHTDLRYFADAAPGAAASVQQVLEVSVSHPKNPSRGFKRLPFQPQADPDAEPLVDCQRLEGVPRARPKARAALAGFEVCGVRLLRWVQGDVDRLELAVVGQATVEGKRWLQVLIDPSINRRAWVRYAPGRSGEPLMRLRRLGDWITSARRGTVPGHAARKIALRSGPSDSSEPSASQLSREGADVPVDVLGVQGDWVRIAAESDACERDAEADQCPSGWARWRSEDGEPLVLP
ncbi:MAG: hypothetical protein HY553_07310 [Elusimicrobia bacterium]|nr:hypothetical protein [Elusimicrobiota bacterium]